MEDTIPVLHSVDDDISSSSSGSSDDVSTDREDGFGHHHHSVPPLTSPPSGQQLYGRRWYVLVVFSLVCFTQGGIWNTWGPLADSAQAAFGWTDATVALLTNWGPITYIISTAFFAWMMDVKGMRYASIVAAGLVAAGTGVRCITSSTPAVTWLMHLGQILNGLGGPVAMGGPPVVSAAWFPANQRTTATGFSSIMNGMGVAVSFIIGPMLVPEPKDCTNTSTSSNSSNGNCSDAQHKQEITDGITNLMYGEFAWSALLFLAILIYFPARPPTPPSVTASVKRTSFKRGISDLLRHRKFWMLGLPYAISSGVFSGWSSVLVINLQPLGVSEDEAGWLGFWGTVAGQVSGLIISFFADLFSRRIRVFLIGLYGVAAVMFLTFALLCSPYVAYSTVVIFVTMIIGSLCVDGAPPLFFEMACESTYPIAEGVTNGLLTWLNNLTGLIFLFLVMIPMGTAWMNWVMVACVAVCIPVFFFYKERYGRMDIDRPKSGSILVIQTPAPRRMQSAVEDDVSNESEGEVFDGQLSDTERLVL